MKAALTLIITVIFIVLTPLAPGLAEVEWTLHRTFKTGKPPQSFSTGN